MRDERGRHLRQRPHRENGSPPLRKRDAETAILSGRRITRRLFAGRVLHPSGLEVVQIVRERGARMHNRQRRKDDSESCQENLSTADLHRAWILSWEKTGRVDSVVSV